MQKQAKGSCDICKAELYAKDEVNLRRVIGYHKRHYHGIIGKYSTPEGKRIAARERHWRLKGFSEEKIAEIRQKYQSQEQQPAAGTEPIRKKATGATPLSLNECPLCHARFYYTQP